MKNVPGRVLPWDPVFLDSLWGTLLWGGSRKQWYRKAVAIKALVDLQSEP